MGKVGRPKQYADKPLQVRLPESELRTVRRLANRAKLSISEWIRAAIRAAIA